MFQTLLEKHVRAALKTAWPQAALDRLQAMESHGLQQIYKVEVTEGKPLTLILEPSSMLRLLRSERSMVESQVFVIQWLRDSLSATDIATSASGSDAGRGNQLCSSRRTTARRAEKCHEVSDIDAYLLRCLPTLIYHHLPLSDDFDDAYSIVRPPPGVPLSLLPTPLSSTERECVATQSSRLFERLCQFTSPTRRFGPAADVLAMDYSTPVADGGGSHTWPAAFHLMFEGILRDGEDMAVNLPYDMMRKHFQRWEHLLGAVTEPRFVLLDATEHSNLLAVSTAKSHATSANGKHRDRHTAESAPPLYDESAMAYSSSSSSSSPSSPNTESRVCLTGLRDWSNSVFGDPLLASAFSGVPLQALQDGFGGIQRAMARQGFRLEPGLVQDEDGAATRLLLYQAFHAVYAVMREIYRPQSGSSKREMAARARLRDILVALEQGLEDGKASTSGRKHRRRKSPGRSQKAGGRSN